jgi:ferredoxin
MGLLLAGFDVVAVDCVAAAIMGVNPKEVRHLVHAGKAGLGCNNLSEIDIVGEQIKNVKRRFKRPRGSRFFETYSKLQYKGVSLILRTTGIDIRPMLKRLISFTLAKPRRVHNLCKNCRKCVDICPVDAIRMEDDVPVIDYYKCTRCMLCYESCPEQAYQIARLPLWYLQLRSKRKKKRNGK